MNARVERWHKVSELFDRVADLVPEERERILAAECAADPELRTEVERLLRADERTNPLDQDIAAEASALLLAGDPHEHEGELFGPYRIVRLLGQGGMGRVYLAERAGGDFAQTVALKLVGGFGNFDAALARRRFLDERRMLARLQHPHIARLLDGGVGPEAQPWFAMEYVDGAPLTEWCDARELGVHERLGLFAKVCDAVDHAHRFLIVHRDLKPGNVLVDDSGEPKVLDFGIAKLLDEGDAARTGSTILMTPDYAAPEQIRGGQISTATDVYSLGAVLFELLTGRKPFNDPLAPREPPQASRVATEGQRTDKRAQLRHTTPQALRKVLRGDIDRILRTALDPDPARRYRSAARLAEDLRAVVAGQPISLRSDRAYRAGIFLRRHRLGVAAASIAILGLIGTTGWALWQTKQAAARATEATKEALVSQKVSDLLASAFDASSPFMKTSVTKPEPTAKDVIDASAAQITEQLAETPKVRATLEALLGRAYLNLGIDDKAVEMLEKAIADHLSKTVDQPLEAADAMVMLSLAEGNRGHVQPSIDWARRSLATRQHVGVPPEDLIDSYNTLGMALIGPGHYAEAEQVFSANHQLKIKAFGPFSLEVRNSLNNMGYLANDSGRVREAERLLRACLAVGVKRNEKPYAVYRTNNVLAVALYSQGKFAEAEKVLSANLKLVPTFNIEQGSSTTVSRLARLHREQGDLALAQAGFDDAIAIEAKVSGPRSVAMAKLVLALAEVLEARGDTASAQKNYVLASTILEHELPASDPDRLRAMAYRDVFLRRHHKQDAPEAQLETTLSHWLALHGSTSGAPIPPDLADAKFLEAERRIAAGQVEGMETLLPAPDPTLEQPLVQARRHYWLGRAHSRTSDKATALGDFQRALQIVDSVAGKESAWGALWRLDYAEQLISAGQRQQARSQLALAEPVLKKQLVPAADSLQRLALLQHAATSSG